MKQSKIREDILSIVRGNLAWADAMSKVCLDQHKLHPEKFPIDKMKDTFEPGELRD